MTHEIKNQRIDYLRRNLEVMIMLLDSSQTMDMLAHKEDKDLFDQLKWIHRNMYKQVLTRHEVLAEKLPSTRY